MKAFLPSIAVAFVALAPFASSDAEAATRFVPAASCVPQGGCVDSNNDVLASNISVDTGALYTVCRLWFCPILEDSMLVSDPQITSVQVDEYNYASATASANVCVINRDGSGGSCGGVQSLTAAGALTLTPDISALRSDAGNAYPYVFVAVDQADGDFVGIYITY